MASPRVIIGTKTYYFGLGGGRFELEQFLKQNQSKYQLTTQVIATMNDSKSIERMLLHLSPQTVDSGVSGSEDAQMEQTNDAF